jgi:hypothetical protein
MSRRVIPGLEAPDPVLEADVRRRLGDVEVALEKAVRAESEMLAETASYLLASGGKRFRPMLVLLSGYFGDPTDPRLVAGSVAIELVHTPVTNGLRRYRPRDPASEDRPWPLPSTSITPPTAPALIAAVTTR